ncbi:unnamed protein product, partial [Durusdinium trenchii]
LYISLDHPVGGCHDDLDGPTWVLDTVKFLKLRRATSACSLHRLRVERRLKQAPIQQACADSLRTTLQNNRAAAPCLWLHSQKTIQSLGPQVDQLRSEASRNEPKTLQWRGWILRLIDLLLGLLFGLRHSSIRSRASLESGREAGIAPTASGPPSAVLLNFLRQLLLLSCSKVRDLREPVWSSSLRAHRSTDAILCLKGFRIVQKLEKNHSFHSWFNPF